jgi:two-component system, sensor histidine kinase and response regulator
MEESKLHHPIRMLYVEDEADTREILQQALENEYPDIVLYVAKDGADGLESFRANSPDVVITDVRMPVMDGLRMSAEIKAIAPDVEVIAMTAYSETAFLLKAIEVGINHYVLKPVDYDKLFPAIEKSLEIIRLKRQVLEYAAEMEKRVRELRESEERLRCANEELETFSYAVAHDLRKPLNVVNGYCQGVLALCGKELDEECLGYIRGAYDGTLRMNRLITSLLMLSQARYSDFKIDKVDLSELALEVAKELEVAEPERKVEVSVAAGVAARGDANLLRAVLANLMGNAWKYSANREQAVIEFGAVEAAGARAFYVRDNGIGLDPEQSQDLFKPFRRDSDGGEVEGLGIGLATVERIVRRHGGRVWAEGEPGKGTTVYFTLSEESLSP